MTTTMRKPQPQPQPQALPVWRIVRKSNTRYLVGRIGKYTVEVGGVWKRKPTHGNEFFVNYRSKGEMAGLRTYAQLGVLFVEALAVEAPNGRYVQFGSGTGS